MKSFVHAKHRIHVAATFDRNPGRVLNIADFQSAVGLVAVVIVESVLDKNALCSVQAR
jgi:hypothetical protein